MDDSTLKSELVAKIAMRDQRVDHFNFDLKKLKTIWENGDIWPAKATAGQVGGGNISGKPTESEVSIVKPLMLPSV